MIKDQNVKESQRKKKPPRTAPRARKLKLDTLSIFFSLITIISTLIHLKLVHTLQTSINLPNGLPNSKEKTNLPTTLADVKKNLTELATVAPDYGDTDWICLLYNSGGRTVPPIRYKLQIWRFFTSLFLHTNFRHLFANLFVLYFLLKMIKWFYPDRKIIFSFFKSAVLGNMISSFFNPSELVIGLSPGVYGALGLLFFKLFYLKLRNYKCFKNLREVSLGSEEEENSAKRKKEERNWNLSFMIGLIVLGFGVYNPYSQIDVSSHVFGFIFGFLYGYFELLRMKDSEGKMKFRMVVGEILTTIVFLSLFGYLFWVRFTSREMALAAAFNMGCN